MDLVERLRAALSRLEVVTDRAELRRLYVEAFEAGLLALTIDRSGLTLEGRFWQRRAELDRPMTVGPRR